MPCVTVTARVEPGRGRSTAPSPGPSMRRPTNGLPTVNACTSWSYWRTSGSLEAMLGSASSRGNTSCGAGGVRPASTGGGSGARHAARSFIFGRP